MPAGPLSSEYWRTLAALVGVSVRVSLPAVPVNTVFPEVLFTFSVSMPL